MLELPPDEGSPDSAFAEDLAVVVNGIALMCRPGPHRMAEVGGNVVPSANFSNYVHFVQCCSSAECLKVFFTYLPHLLSQFCEEQATKTNNVYFTRNKFDII